MTVAVSLKKTVDAELAAYDAGDAGGRIPTLMALAERYTPGEVDRILDWEGAEAARACVAFLRDLRPE